MTEPVINPSEETASLDSPEASSRFADWGRTVLAYLPILLIIVALSALTTVTLNRFMPGGAGRIVVFDVLKFVNAERAIAAKLLGDQPDTRAAVMLDRVGARADAVIREVAGAGTLVLVKQAVVGEGFRDITDEVLTRLDLPTDVPSHVISSDLTAMPGPTANPRAKRSVDLGPDILP